MKIKVWRIEQAMWGADNPYIEYFRTQEAFDNYSKSHDHFTKLEPVMMDEDEIGLVDGPWFYEDMEQY